MKKPWWIRVVGLAGLVSLALSAAMLFAGPLPNAAPGQLIAIYFFGMAGMGLLGAWAVMSFVLYVAARVGRQQAAIIRDAAATAAAAMRVGSGPQLDAAMTDFKATGAANRAINGPPPLPPRGDVWDNPATKIRCDGCGRFHALLFCTLHRQFLCFPCSAKQDSANCFYQAAGRMVDEAHKQTAPRRAVGSVLGI